MKITSLVFIGLILLTVSKYLGILIIDKLVIIGVSVLWLACIYIGIHLKNKDRNTPRPVYLTQ